MTWSPSEGILGTVTGPVPCPTTMDGVWADVKWQSAFLDWAADQPDFTYSLACAVYYGDSYRQAPSLENAQSVGGLLLGAAPPLEAAEIQEVIADAAQVAGEGDIHDPKVFDSLLAQAWEHLSNPLILAAFHADADAVKHPDDPRGVGWIQTADGAQFMGMTDADPTFDGQSMDGYYAAPPELLAQVAEVNADNVKELEDGDSTSFRQAGNLILIGDGHPRQAHMIANKFGTQGTVVVKKGWGLDPGSLTVTGAFDQAAVVAHVAEWSKKKVKFA